VKATFGRSAKLYLTATIFTGIAFSFWELFFNIYMISSGVGKDTLGLIRSISALMALPLGLPLGKLADRIGYRKSLIMGLGIAFIGMTMQVILKAPALIILMAAVQGTGLMLYHVASSPFIMKSSTPENRAVFFSLTYSLTTLAGMVGNLVAGQLPGLAARILGQNIGASAYRLVILTGIFLGLLCLIPLSLIKKENLIQPKEAFPPSPILSLKKLFSNRFVSLLFIRNVMVGLGAALLIPYLNVFFREEHKLSDQSLGLLFALSSFLVIIGTTLAPWLARKMHSKINTVNITQIISIAFMLVLGFSPLLWLAQIGYLMRTVFMQLSSPLLDNFNMEASPPGQQSTVAGLKWIGWQIGQAIGLYVSGLVQVRYGFTPLFIATSILYLASIFLAHKHFRPIEKELALSRGK